MANATADARGRSNAADRHPRLDQECVLRRCSTGGDEELCGADYLLMLSLIGMTIAMIVIATWTTSPTHPVLSP